MSHRGSSFEDNFPWKHLSGAWKWLPFLFSDWKGHAQWSLSLHSPINQEIAAKFFLKACDVGTFLCGWKVVCFPYSLFNSWWLQQNYLCLCWMQLLTELCCWIIMFNKLWCLITACVYESIFISAISMCLLKITTNKDKTIEQAAHHLMRNLFSSEFSAQYTGKKYWYYIPLGWIIPLILM